MKYKSFVVVVLVCIHLSDGLASESFTTPNNQYVLIERQLNQAYKADYAGFKFIQQGASLKDLIKYDWISMNKGENLVQVEAQNFKWGVTTTVGKFGIGFEGYRFLWEPENIIKNGQSICALPCEGIIKICLSEFRDLWGVNIQEEMSKLELKNRCVQWE